MSIFNENKRCEIDIINDILIYAQKDIKKTRLLYRTNLSYSTFSKYLHFLLEKKLLEAKNGNPSGNVYCITKKGKAVLKDIQDINKQLK